MNVVGLDPQPSGVRASLREGVSPAWPPAAVSEPRPTRQTLAALLTQPGKFADQPVDWSSLVERLGRFLGEPAEHLGLSAFAFAGRVRGGEAPSALGVAHRVSACDAALIGAFGEGYRPMGFADSVLVVVVGEIKVEVHGYRVRRGSTGARVDPAPTPVTITETGGAYWASEVATVLTAAAPELDVAAASQLIWTGAAELARRLTDAPADDAALRWTGPLADTMHVPPSFSRQHCRHWPSLARLQATLPDALWQLARQLGVEAQPAVVVAGPGAAWPFATALAREVGVTHVLANPDLAVARGAAWWPRIGDTLFGGRASVATPSTPPRIAHTPAAAPPRIEPTTPPTSRITQPPPASVDEADLALLERLSRGAPTGSQRS